MKDAIGKQFLGLLDGAGRDMMRESGFVFLPELTKSFCKPLSHCGAGVGSEFLLH